MYVAYGPDREMFCAFCEMKDYDNYLIGKLSCVRMNGWSVSGKIQIQKQRKNFVILELQRGKYLLTMTLVRPKRWEQLAESDRTMTWKPKSEINRVISNQVIARHSFTVEEVLEFVKSVRDTNGIHQTADPVVPGLLMLEWYFAVLQSSDWKMAEIRFHAPAYTGQVLCITKEVEKYVCYGENTGQMFWTATIKEGKNSVLPVE